jgi:hypothetical protein
MELDAMNADIFGPDVNYVPTRNVYPTAAGGTLGSAAAATSPDNVFTGVTPIGNANANANPSVQAPTSPTVAGHPFTWWLGSLILVAGMVFFAHKTGDSSDFGNIRASAYNVLLITFVALLGLTLGKVVLTRFPVPGLSQVWIAA